MEWLCCSMPYTLNYQVKADTIEKHGQSKMISFYYICCITNCCNRNFINYKCGFVRGIVF
jgi:hypothetical protein